MIWLSDIDNETFIFHAADIGVFQATHVMKRTSNNEQIECVHLQIWMKYNAPADAPTLSVYVDDEVYENLTTELRDDH